jgi:hypothetical protein
MFGEAKLLIGFVTAAHILDLIWMDHFKRQNVAETDKETS